MQETFISLLPNIEDALALEVEDFAAVVFEVMPGVTQNQLVHALAMAKPITRVPSESLHT
jgi:hypothetical protein